MIRMSGYSAVGTEVTRFSMFGDEKRTKPWG
jgi:hypothetical protein